MDIRRRANPVCDCPITAAQVATSGKWKMIIIYWLGERPRHFAALRREMPSSISQKVLTRQLKELVADDIVHREETGPVPAKVIYSLTDHGRTLLPLVEAVRQWGRGHIKHHSE